MHAGGIVVCCGSGCDVDFTECVLNCTLVVMEGARVALTETRVSPNHSHGCEVKELAQAASKGVAVLLTGAGTTVHMTGGGTDGGLLGVTVQDGAHFVGGPNRDLPEDVKNATGNQMARLNFANFGVTGVDVSGDASTLELSFANLSVVGGPDFPMETLTCLTCFEQRVVRGVHVRSNCKAEISNLFTKMENADCGDVMHHGFEISTAEPVKLHRCHVEKSIKAGVQSLLDYSVHSMHCFLSFP